MSSKYVRYTSDGEWSALYVDGKLERVGDHYLVDEHISYLLGVDDFDSNDFLQGGSSREDVAQTLDELSNYTASEREKQERADELEKQARELERQAAALRSQK